MKSLMFGINFLLLVVATFRFALVILRSKSTLSFGSFHSLLGHFCIIIFLLDQNSFIPQVQNLSLALCATFLATIPGAVLCHTGREHRIKRRASTRFPVIYFLAGLYLGDLPFIGIFYASSLVLSYYFVVSIKTEHLLIWRNLVWFFISSALLVVMSYLRHYLSLELLEIIIMAGFLLPYWFYTKLLNAITVADYFEKKLA